MTNIWPSQADFYRSPKWARMKFEYFRTHERLCAVCRNIDKIQNPIHLHHINYDRWGGDELATDLVPLCQNHHREFHESWDGDLSDSVALAEATEYFIKAHRPDAKIDLSSDEDQFTIMFVYGKWATV